METVDVRVARGAGWLDAVYPEWWTKIDVGALDLKDSCRCVLGQIEGRVGDSMKGPNGYGRVIKGDGRVLTMPAEVEDAEDWVGAHGFDAVDTLGEYTALDEAWITQIKARWERGL